LTGNDRPPLTSEIFEKGYKLGIFAKDRFPRLYETLTLWFKEERGVDPPEPFKEVDAEEFLTWLVMKDDQGGTLFGKALSQSWYYIFDIFNHYSSAYARDHDAYRALADHHKREPYNAISLNYDTIFEMAILKAGMNYNYFPPSKSGAIPLAKVHGSINWHNRDNPAIGVTGPGLATLAGLFEFVSTFVYSNVMISAPPKIHDPRSLVGADFSMMLRSGIDFDEPIVIPPMAAKDFEKSPLYKDSWDYAEQMISQATELVLIGTTLRLADERLCEVITRNLRPGTKIIAVRGMEKIQRTLSKLLSWEPKIQGGYSGFSEYAHSLN